MHKADHDGAAAPVRFRVARCQQAHRWRQRQRQLPASVSSGDAGGTQRAVTQRRPRAASEQRQSPFVRPEALQRPPSAPSMPEDAHMPPPPPAPAFVSPAPRVPPPLCPPSRLRLHTPLVTRQGISGAGAASRGWPRACVHAAPLSGCHHPRGLASFWEFTTAHRCHCVIAALDVILSIARFMSSHPRRLSLPLLLRLAASCSRRRSRSARRRLAATSIVGGGAAVRSSRGGLVSPNSFSLSVSFSVSLAHRLPLSLSLPASRSFFLSLPGVAPTPASMRPASATSS